tara:strand:- start:572 stop:1732 length:1161 start_codon:yes stop_codon:yes gene_type:complete
MRKICVVIGSRANYSSIKSALKAIKVHPKLELQIVANASAVLEKYGNVAQLIENDGFTINEKFYMLIEGENPTTMAKSTGLGLLEIPTIFERLQPDVVFTIGDRYETMSTTIAASYMNITIAHSMGGEVTGTIDESIRHAVTKFAHIHFPANEDSKIRIQKMGEDERFIFNVGCPRIDLVKKEINKKNSDILLKEFFENCKGVGRDMDIKDNFLLVSQHPVTTEYGVNRENINYTLEALDQLKMPTIMLWPNADAGGELISKAIRTFREKNNPKWLAIYKNLPIKIYINLMKTTLCLIGNSSSGIREGAFIGTPVVNIGSRQNSRMKGPNCIDVGNNTKEIKDAILKQIKHGKYQSYHLYGDGNAGTKIAKILSDVELKIQKTITY